MSRVKPVGSLGWKPATTRLSHMMTLSIVAGTTVQLPEATISTLRTVARPSFLPFPQLNVLVTRYIVVEQTPFETLTVLVFSSGNFSCFID